MSRLGFVMGRGRNWLGGTAIKTTMQGGLPALRGVNCKCLGKSAWPIPPCAMHTKGADPDRCVFCGHLLTCNFTRIMVTPPPRRTM